MTVGAVIGETLMMYLAFVAPDTFTDKCGDILVTVTRTLEPLNHDHVLPTPDTRITMSFEVTPVLANRAGDLSYFSFHNDVIPCRAEGIV